MARKKRYHIPGAFYHVMMRGNDGQQIFFYNEERCRMCLLIQEGVERFGHRIHAFCFMGNHIHLLIQVNTISLSEIIHNLTFRYSQYINRRHKKIGHLFQGRYKAILIQENAYYLRLLRYIHMNPVRAHLVKTPESYPWSGHRAYLGQVEFAWLTTEYGLGKFANRFNEAQLKYRDYVLMQESENCLNELRHGFSDGQILGDDTFLKEVRNAQNDESTTKIPLKVILEAIYQVYNVDLISLSSPIRSDNLSLIRGAAATLARQKGNTIEEIAKAFNRDETSISRSIQRFHQKCASTENIRTQYRLAEEITSSCAVMQA